MPRKVSDYDRRTAAPPQGSESVQCIAVEQATKVKRRRMKARFVFPFCFWMILKNEKIAKNKRERRRWHGYLMW
jgi:hypothetical protein